MQRTILYKGPHGGSTSTSRTYTSSTKYILCMSTDQQKESDLQ